jgi:A/G-specific adenine glycosylase
MLQQTQVTTVRPYFARWMAALPDFAALAAAPEAQVLKLWEGLGYYSRARNLHAAACCVVDTFDGRFPETVDALETLPGVGRSTAGAIAAFAHGRKAAILDGNVKRVFARIFLIEGVPASTTFTRIGWALAERLLPERDIERYTQGLMDLGATICTPRRPACLLCPFETTCRARREGREATLPERAERKVLPRRRATLLLATWRGAILLERRPPVGIWGGLWSLPEADVDTIAGRFGNAVRIANGTGFVHGFTHYVLEADVVRVTLADDASPTHGVRDGRDERWVAFDELVKLGLPTPIRALLAATT